MHGQRGDDRLRRALHRARALPGLPRLGRRHPLNALRTITVYGRPDCHLCDEALRAISALRGDLGEFDLVEVDIDSDDGLLAAYLERIPVVEVDGAIVSELELDEAALRVALRPGGP